MVHRWYFVSSQTIQVYAVKPSADSSQFMYENFFENRDSVNALSLLQPLLSFTNRMECNLWPYSDTLRTRYPFSFTCSIHTGNSVFYHSFQLFFSLTCPARAAFHPCSACNQPRVRELSLSHMYRKSASSKHCDLIRQSWFYWFSQYTLCMEDFVYPISIQSASRWEEVLLTEKFAHINFKFDCSGPYVHAIFLGKFRQMIIILLFEMWGYGPLLSFLAFRGACLVHFSRLSSDSPWTLKD
jgi:hypothetical protein